ncbi:hypothetical protein ABID16_000037 [Rhizobium aquaticum]|uniref:Uncharacterized protein n=1 Tax=Rhizobium aquaticum TaxID=1549636 RepID=A0ABV2ITB4_9HYPH
MTFDILEEAPFRFDLGDDASDARPKMAGVVFSFSQAGKGEWLAWISSSDEMNLSTPRHAVEGGNIVPNRSVIQGRVSHPRHEGGRWENFPLNVADSTISGFCDMEADLQSSNASAEGKSVKPIISLGI